ncbi:hypothetical protein PVK06_043149 [Gossypium arboreum]|uniref:Uncharacterized protein n=1 Tax=Gossypium arboreum TaxID=29729 RepID=A0ABR0MMP9_GOSAR|nr:hypothetical protein PVK06_043149 [Gossypium arboreum]
MEAWFILTMLQSNDCYNLRLDRHLPDNFDFTFDCKPRRKHSTVGVHHHLHHHLRRYHTVTRAPS